MKKRPPMVRRPRGRGVLEVAVILIAAALAACEDEATDPGALVVAEESEAALALGVELPDPSGWTLPQDAGPEAAEALASWTASWDAPSDAAAMREAAYRRLAETFAPALGRGGVAEEVDRLSEAVRRAAGLPLDELPERIQAKVDAAREAYAEAALALRADAPDRALEQVLRGADALREVGPEAVARSLAAEVEAALGRFEHDDAYSEKDRLRLRRLVSGARTAVRDGAWVLAIRRAYYARGLMAQLDAR